MKKIKNIFFSLQLWLINKIKNFKWQKIKKNSSNFLFFLKKNFCLILTSVFKNLKIYIYLFIVPLILSILIFSYQTYAGLNQPLPAITAGYLLIPGFGLILGLNTLISDWKSSIFLKRINLIGTTKTQFLLAIWIVGYLIGLISTLFCTSIIILFAELTKNYNNSFLEMFAFLSYGSSKEIINAWLGFFLGLSTIIFSSIGLATLISGAFYNIALAQSLSILIIIVTFVLSDLFLNPVILAGSKAVIIISYFVPQKYGAWTVFYAVSANNLNYFLPNPGSNKLTISFLNITWPIINSIIYSFALFYLSIFTFKWNNRG